MTKIAGSGSESISQRHGSGSTPKCHGSGTLQAEGRIYLAAKAAANEVEVHSPRHQEGGNGQAVRSDAAIRQDDELRIGRGSFHPAANCRYFCLGELNENLEK